jgi:hypothetical protein
MSVPVRVSPPRYLACARSQACASWRNALQQRVNVEDCYRVDDQEVELARVGDRTEAPGYLAAQQVTEEVDDLQDTGQQKPYSPHSAPPNAHFLHYGLTPTNPGYFWLRSYFAGTEHNKG